MDGMDDDGMTTGTDAAAQREARAAERQSRRDGDDDIGGASVSPLRDRRVLGAVGAIAAIVLVIIIF